MLLISHLYHLHIFHPVLIKLQKHPILIIMLKNGQDNVISMIMSLSVAIGMYPLLLFELLYLM